MLFALALAAQKTVENLFGSVAIDVDQPFRVGDFVKADDVVGMGRAVVLELLDVHRDRVRHLLAGAGQ